MSGYRFKAMNRHGKMVSSRMDAHNVEDLERRLLQMDLDMVNCQELPGQGEKITRGRIQRQEMITFCFHLEQVMGSGVPLLAGLVDLRDSSENPVMQSLLAGVIEDVSGGSQLSEALGRFPKVFDGVFTSLVRAGEQTGNLQVIFANLAETIKWQDELAVKTRKLLMYPAFVSIIVTGVFFFMMTFLVPQLISFLKMMEMELPLHTRLLIRVSAFIVTWWPMLLGLPLVLGVVIYFTVRASPMARYALDWVKLHLWVLGPILQKIILARFATVFSMMYGAGITVLDCLEISEKVAGNQVMGRVMREVSTMIGDGESITTSFRKTMIFPPLVLRMLNVGESTGALEKSLLNVRYFYDREVKDSVDRLQGMIEPVLTLILGGLMAWIILSVLGPIYDIMNKVGH